MEAKKGLFGGGGDPHNTDGAAVMHRRGSLAIQNSTPSNVQIDEAPPVTN
jgi:hypothetical protein